MSELQGRGAAWTEERGTSDEGPAAAGGQASKAAPKSAPEASGKHSMSGYLGSWPSSTRCTIRSTCAGS
jgi:hypothetical protein